MDETLWHAPQEPPGSAARRVWDWYSNVSHERHNSFTAIAGVRRLLQRVVLAGTFAWALVTSAVTSDASTRPVALPHEPLKVGMVGYFSRREGDLTRYIITTLALFTTFYHSSLY